MTFNPNIPQATDLISQSQSQLQTNFSQSNTAFAVDHTAFDVVTNQGKHKKSTYVEQGSDPATLVNEMSLYSKDLAGVTTLYLRKENNGTVIRMSAQDPIIATSGSTFLPGGIILKWGQVAAAVNNSTVTFASAFPTACYGVNINVLLGAIGAGTIVVKNGSVTTSQFVVLSSYGPAVPIFYFAIGN